MSIRRGKQTNIGEKTLSPAHVNSASNGEIQAEFIYFIIHGKKLEIINIIDSGTKYGEMAITSLRSAEQKKHLCKTMWLYRNGEPRRFSADRQLCRPVLFQFIALHKTKVNPPPSSSSNKTGTDERNNKVFTFFIEQLQKEDTEGKMERIIERPRSPIWCFGKR